MNELTKNTHFEKPVCALLKFHNIYLMQIYLFELCMNGWMDDFDFT